MTLFFSTLLIYLSYNIYEIPYNVNQTVLWKQGEGKYKNYRIPSIITTKNGTILAFCEGREAGDTGNIDVLIKRSNDNGKTWSKTSVVWDDELNTCGNPTPVQDEITGRIWLFMTWNNGKDDETQIINKTSISRRLPYLSYSDDDGLTWSKPKNMSNSCSKEEWGWYATGPGVGIQIKNGSYKGRLVVPANHSYDDKNGNIRNGPYNYGAHSIYSDDNGETWSISESIKPGCNESQLVEIDDGNLLINMRSYNDKNSRAIAVSNNGGSSWSEIKHDLSLVESRCQASIINYGLYNNNNVHLFSNPSVPNGRYNMTVKVSYDECKTWANSVLIHPGPSAYSCLSRLPDGNIGIFYERGIKHPYEELVFQSISPEMIISKNILY